MKKLAFTVYRQDPYLDLWLKYYSQFFTDIIVFNDNLPGDTSTELLDFRKRFDFRIEDIRSDRQINEKFIWLTNEVRKWQEYYLKIYDVVLFSGCDEFIVPLHEDLGEYIEHMKEDFARCTGYDVVQQEDEEELDFNRRILKQRKFWTKDPAFNKPLITKIPLGYVEGWHCLTGEGEGSVDGDPNLALIHLKRADSRIHKMRYDNFQFKDRETVSEQEMFHTHKEVFPIPEEWRKRF